MDYIKKYPFTGIVRDKKLIPTPVEVVHPTQPKNAYLNLRQCGRYGVYYTECLGTVLSIGINTCKV